ncbi:GNAT family N-acetyltransferase [Embleya sp. NPDC008237]|uniref:GNAT family N-acetyltransferase n=1 Tax=Embleya sp. NPDC008237 TaxID=3363978 RepID=UPI0036EE0D0E
MTPTPAGARTGGDLYRADREPEPDSGALRDRAAEAADRAARAAHVEIRELHTLGEMADACDLFQRVWQPDPTNPMINSELMTVVSHAGGYVAGTYEGDRLIGAGVGLLSTDGLHSHIAGVDERSRGREVGYALKVYQRAWCLERGITRVTWTFDPLVGRNAYFNLAKLGATPAEYLADFYGPMSDAINGDDLSDRLLARWDLSSDRVALACAGVPQPVDTEDLAGEVVIGLDAAPDGRPIQGRTDGDVVLVAVPRDIEALRRADPSAARGWRLAVREVLGGLMAQGRQVRGFGRDGRYVLDRGPEGRRP